MNRRSFLLAAFAAIGSWFGIRKAVEAPAPLVINYWREDTVIRNVPHLPIETQEAMNYYMSQIYEICYLSPAPPSIGKWRTVRLTRDQRCFNPSRLPA